MHLGSYVPREFFENEKKDTSLASNNSFTFVSNLSVSTVPIIMIIYCMLNKWKRWMMEYVCIGLDCPKKHNVNGIGHLLTLYKEFEKPLNVDVVTRVNWSWFIGYVCTPRDLFDQTQSTKQMTSQKNEIHRKFTYAHAFTCLFP